MQTLSTLCFPVFRCLIVASVSFFWCFSFFLCFCFLYVTLCVSVCMCGTSGTYIVIIINQLINQVWLPFLPSSPAISDYEQPLLSLLTCKVLGSKKVVVVVKELQLQKEGGSVLTLTFFRIVHVKNSLLLVNKLIQFYERSLFPHENKSVIIAPFDCPLVVPENSTCLPHCRGIELLPSP